MDERANIPVSLPRPNPTISYWQDPPDAIADLQSTAELPETADVVLIGSGISGASIAFDLLQRDASSQIVMLEARQACSGATGRNGGHTKAASYRTFSDNADLLGIDEAVKIAQLEYNTIKAVHAFSRTHSIDCDLASVDTVDVIYDQGAWDRGVKSIELMQQSMPLDLEGAAKYTLYSSEETQSKFYCNGDKPIGSISYFAGSLSAYKLVIGMLKLCLKSGLNLQTNTPATSLQQEKDGSWEVRTDRGMIRAKRVVLTTNGYTAYLFKKLQGVIVPLRGQVSVHRPGASMPRHGLATTYSFIYSNGYEYMIPRPNGSKFAGDIVMGGGLAKSRDEGIDEYGNSDDTTLNPEVHDWLEQTTPRYFGDNWGADDKLGRIRKEWTGIMGYAADGFPLVGEIPDKKGLFISASFQGHGMVLCFLCARALVQMMCGEDEKSGPKTWFPEAFRITEERMGKKFQGKSQKKITVDRASRD